MAKKKAQKATQFSVVENNYRIVLNGEIELLTDQISVLKETLKKRKISLKNLNK